MRRIKFDDETIEKIRQYVEVEQHTVLEACNKFTLKQDTMRRVLFENNIKPKSKNHTSNRKCVLVYDDIPQSTVNFVCNMYQNTDMRLQDIVRESKLQNYAVQMILDKNFSIEFQQKRKSKLYRYSKLGDKNPMKQLTGEKHPNYKGLVDDGNGYFMIQKPDWYTGRKKSQYVFYHSVVMCENLGITEIPKGFCVHHIDMNTKNNDISNLALVSISAHAKLHAFETTLMKGAETIHNGVGETRNAEQ